MLPYVSRFKGYRVIFSVLKFNKISKTLLTTFLLSASFVNTKVAAEESKEVNQAPRSVKITEKLGWSEETGSVKSSSG